MDYTAIISKMGTFIVLIVVGYAFARLKITGEEFNKACSKLVINFFLAAMILSSVVNKEMSMSGKELLFGFLMMILAFVLDLALAFAASQIKSLREGDRAMHRILMCYMNNAFIGLPIVAAMYGENAVFFASLMNIPFNLTLYTIGVGQLRKGSNEKGFSLKSVFTPPLIATLVAVVIFALKPRVPFFIEDMLGTVSSATVPMSMLIVGSSLGNVSIKDALRDANMYKMSFVRLILCPLLVWLVLRNVMTDRVMLGTIVVLVAMPMAVIATPLGIANGRDGVESSECIFISTVLSMVTIPLIILLLGL